MEVLLSYDYSPCVVVRRLWRCCCHTTTARVLLSGDRGGVVVIRLQPMCCCQETVEVLLSYDYSLCVVVR